MVVAKIKININSEMFFKEKLNLKTLTTVLIKSNPTKSTYKLVSLLGLSLIINRDNGINIIEKLTKTGIFI